MASANMPKVVVVFGATGRQGGSVINALINDSTFKLKAVTRFPNSKNAKWLTSNGIEVVKGDLSKLETLKPILKGVYGCFLVTDFWNCYSKEKEFRLGENVINLAKIYGLQHVIFSGLESIQLETGQQCDHFEGKAQIVEYIKQVRLPYTVIRLPQFMENFINVYPPVKQRNGHFSLDIPVGNSKIYFIPAIEIGKCVQVIFHNPEKFNQQILDLASDYLTVQECSQILCKELKPLIFYDGKMTCEMYLKEDFANVEDLVNMFIYIKENKMIRDINMTKSLDPCISDFETWVKRNKEKLLNLLQDKSP